MRKILMRFFLLMQLCFIGKGAFASTDRASDFPPPLSTIDFQLSQATHDFSIAQKMFNPWYGGPLMTPGAHNAPPGTCVVQPYVFTTQAFGQFNEKGKRIPTSKTWTINPLYIFQMGVLSWLDFACKVQGVYRKQGAQDFFYWGDAAIYFGIQLMRETPYRPAIRLSLSESFPTGKYQKLNPDKKGMDATGSGAYTTTLSLNASKVIWWLLNHPFAFRASLNYSFPEKTRVRGYHAYGGGIGTKGSMHLGNAVAVDTSVEFSVTQKWVIAVDLAYTYGSESTFSGRIGKSELDPICHLKIPSNESLSCSPALQYNFSDHFGCLAGVWFPLKGKNTTAFLSGVFTLYYSW